MAVNRYIIVRKARDVDEAESIAFSRYHRYRSERHVSSIYPAPAPIDERRLGESEENTSTKEIDFTEKSLTRQY